MRPSRELVGQCRDQFASAFNRQDMPTLRALCDAGIILLPPSSEPVVGIEAVLDWYRIGFSVSRTVLSVQPRELHVATDWTLDWFDWTLSTVRIKGGAPLIDHGSSFWIWRFSARGECRLARQIWNSGTAVPSLWAGGWTSVHGDPFPRLMSPVW